MNIDPDNTIVISSHAALRMRQMDLGRAEVLAALRWPDLEYPGRPGRDGRRCRVAVKGRLAVVRSIDGIVVTVLWHGAEGRVAA